MLAFDLPNSALRDAFGREHTNWDCFVVRCGERSIVCTGPGCDRDIMRSLCASWKKKRQTQLAANWISMSKKPLGSEKSAMSNLHRAGARFRGILKTTPSAPNRPKPPPNQRSPQAGLEEITLAFLR